MVITAMLAFRLLSLLLLCPLARLQDSRAFRRERAEPDTWQDELRTGEVAGVAR